MMRIPRRYIPLTYGVIQAAITTGIASAIATFQAVGLDWAALNSWLWAWGISWIMILPVVVVVAPFIQRLVMSLAQP